MTTTCKHTQKRQVGPDRCFTGSVADHSRSENQAAHGALTYTLECLLCGAQRHCNQNQTFFEYSSWGPSRAQQRAKAALKLNLLSSKVPPKPQPIELTSRSRAISVEVYCTEDGMISFRGAPREAEGAIARALPEHWLSAAKAVRQHYLQVQITRAQLHDDRSA